MTLHHLNSSRSRSRGRSTAMVKTGEVVAVAAAVVASLHGCAADAQDGGEARTAPNSHRWSPLHRRRMATQQSKHLVEVTTLQAMAWLSGVQTKTSTRSSVHRLDAMSGAKLWSWISTRPWSTALSERQPRRTSSSLWSSKEKTTVFMFERDRGLMSSCSKWLRCTRSSFTRHPWPSMQIPCLMSWIRITQSPPACSERPAPVIQVAM
mmetsp:Transcript_18287/g.39079  ORF Transcript_18287/g.39079 Transcript_18287/m.39079 type:complete len:208 (-) Transcript_18287:622-1245(-)